MSRARLNGGFAGAEDEATFRYPRQLAEVLTAFDSGRPLQIVDLGSALGTLTIWLASVDPRFTVTGFDRHPGLVAAAAARANAAGSSARFVVADVGVGLPAEDASLDAVVVHRLRDSIVAPQQRRTLTTELSRVIRPGGWLSLLEDMRVEPHEPHGEWYARRYRVHRRVLEVLITDGHLEPSPYSGWLAEPGTELLMSLRAPDGTKLDDVAYEGRERNLAAAIAHGDVTLRGIGIHQSVGRVRAELAGLELAVDQSWTVEISERSPRSGHAVVMKGLLCQRRGPQARGSATSPVRW